MITQTDTASAFPAAVDAVDTAGVALDTECLLRRADGFVIVRSADMIHRAGGIVRARFGANALDTGTNAANGKDCRKRRRTQLTKEANFHWKLH